MHAGPDDWYVAVLDDVLVFVQLEETPPVVTRLYVSAGAGTEINSTTMRSIPLALIRQNAARLRRQMGRASDQLDVSADIGGEEGR